MTPIATARRFARRDAAEMGHRLGRMSPVPASALWVGVCRACGVTLTIEPHPRGEWEWSAPLPCAKATEDA